MCAIATARDFTIKHAMHAQISQILVNDTLSPLRFEFNDVGIWEKEEYSIR